MDWFQFLAFFLALLAAGCFAADNLLDDLIDWLKEKE